MPIFPAVCPSSHSSFTAKRNKGRIASDTGHRTSGWEETWRSVRKLTVYLESTGIRSFFKLLLLPNPLLDSVFSCVCVYMCVYLHWGCQWCPPHWTPGLQVLVPCSHIVPPSGREFSCLPEDPRTEMGCLWHFFFFYIISGMLDPKWNNDYKVKMQIIIFKSIKSQIKSHGLSSSRLSGNPSFTVP